MKVRLTKEDDDIFQALFDRDRSEYQILNSMSTYELTDWAIMDCIAKPGAESYKKHLREGFANDNRR